MHTLCDLEALQQAASVTVSLCALNDISS